MSPKLANGGASTSHESLASAVRARVLRKLERPHSFTDGASLPAVLALMHARAHSVELSYEAETNGDKAGARPSGVSASRSSGEVAALLTQVPRRAASLADVLLRRKPRPLPVHVIENPMHAMPSRDPTLYT